MWGDLWGDRTGKVGFKATQADTGALANRISREGEGLSGTLWESWGSPFKTAAFNHSATTPGGYNVLSHNGLFK
jgi:hypothetical protein